ncbi:flagellar basal body P-ring formation chaperone FlgA [Thermodesulfobacterium hveragerdense]|uniref:flagellar basal body P-ring formation chaperone FlgA n=1 Tax=Thermodesulfobacterium hveragerdense TaxID=53424 RepID=UPI00041A715B|nr:flagellar basal body P-ring formation chaperone FlgA [Thermodesulfobacterium hveragerdense]
MKRSWLLAFFIIFVLSFKPLKGEEFYTEADYKKIFLQEIQARLSKVYPKLSLERFSVEPREAKVIKGIPYQVKFLGRPGLGSNTVILVFFKDGKEAFRVRLWGYVETYAFVAVLAKPLEKGEVITKNHLVFQERPLSRLPQDVVLEEKEVLGKEVRTSLKPNVILRKSFLNEPLLIKRGQEVLIIGRGQGFLVRTKGKALQDGRKGEVIKVKNLTSTKEVLGKVISPNEIEVML